MTVGDLKKDEDESTCAEDMRGHVTHDAESAAGVVYGVAAVIGKSVKS